MAIPPVEPSLVSIAARMTAMPTPRGGNNGTEVLVFWLPSQFLHRAVGRRHQCRRIARTPRSFDYSHGPPRYFFTSPDHLAHAVAAADAEVVLHPLPGSQLQERQQVSFRQVIDVDIVTNAGAVRRRIIGPIN